MRASPRSWRRWSKARTTRASLASASRYPPQGRRSGGGVRPLLAGIDSMLAANQHVAVGAMIETALGAQNAEAICAVEGIDFIFIGTGDLQLSMPGCRAPSN